MIRDVEKLFDARIRAKCKTGIKPEILAFLLKHERKPICIRNICEQIVGCETHLKTKFQAVKFKQLIETIADLFMSQALEAHAVAQMTAMEKRRKIDEANQLDEFAAELEADNAEALNPKLKIYMP